MGKKLISMKIQTFQIPISKTGMADMIYFLFKIFFGQQIRWGLSVVLGEFIVNRHLITGSEEYPLQDKVIQMPNPGPEK